MAKVYTTVHMKGIIFEHIQNDYNDKDITL